MRVFCPPRVAVPFTVMYSYVALPAIVMTVGWSPNGIGHSVTAAGIRNAKNHFHAICNIFKWALESHLHPDCIPLHSQSPQPGVRLPRVVDICSLLKRCSLKWETVLVHFDLLSLGEMQTLHHWPEIPG